MANKSSKTKKDTAKKDPVVVSELDELEALLDDSGDLSTVTASVGADIIIDNDLEDLIDTADGKTPDLKDIKTVKSVEETPADAPTETLTSTSAEDLEDAIEKKPKVAARKRFEKSSENLFSQIGSAEIALTVEDVDRPQDDVRAELASIVDGSAKKVQEKAVNLMVVSVNGGNMSTYTKQALSRLFKEEKTSSADLVAQYQENNYSIGTARAQAGQMMKLLTSLKIAVQSGKDIVVNKSSVLAPVLRELV